MNAFGGLLTTRRHYTHSVIHETLNDLLAIQKEIHAGIFTVMDGTVCGKEQAQDYDSGGKGPHARFRRQHSYKPWSLLR